MSSISVIYGPNAPAFLLTCKEGRWGYSVHSQLESIFGQEHISWDMRDRRDIVIISDVVKFSKMSADHPKLFDFLHTHAEHYQETKRPPHYKLSDILSEVPFVPFFAHWPELKAEKPRVMTGTLRDYRLL